KDLYRSYYQWAKREWENEKQFIENLLSKRAFSVVLEGVGFKPHRGNDGGAGFDGIVLKEFTQLNDHLSDVGNSRMRARMKEFTTTEGSSFSSPPHLGENVGKTEEKHMAICMDVPSEDQKRELIALRDRLLGEYGTFPPDLENYHQAPETYCGRCTMTGCGGHPDYVDQ